MKTLVITGASRGIGFATAQLFCDADYRVINFSRSPAADDRIENFAIDLTAEEAERGINNLLDTLLEPGEIVLVHNAARLTNDSAMDADIEALRLVLNLNVIAPHILNRALIGKMQTGSSIIYIGSTLSEKAVANAFSYATSKHAVVGMMRATCQDLTGTGIHTTCICPGFTDTEMLREHVGDDPGILASIAAASTFNRLVTPREIADSIFFAAQNPVINGAVIHANLGQVQS